MEKKLWSKAELVELGVEDTKETDDTCLLDKAQVLTPIPNGPQGVANCPKWNGVGCTHKNWGKGNTAWPCPQATVVMS